MQRRVLLSDSKARHIPNVPFKPNIAYEIQGTAFIAVPFPLIKKEIPNGISFCDLIK